MLREFINFTFRKKTKDKNSRENQAHPSHVIIAKISSNGILLIIKATKIGISINILHKQKTAKLIAS